MEILIFKGQITATSNKKSDFGDSNSQRKTAYISLDKESQEKVKKFGLRLYTSQENDTFLIVKLSNKLSIYKGDELLEMDTTIGTNNFKSNKVIDIAIMKGNKNKNDFYRLYSVQVDNFSDIEVIKTLNPFTNQEVNKKATFDDTEEENYFVDDDTILEY